jgi:hypothetical protein
VPAGAQDDPLVLPFLAFVLDRPAEVDDAEADGVTNGRELMIVDEDDPALPEQPPRVEQVEEHALEAVVAVEEGEVEAPALGEQPWENDLRLLGVELHEVADAGFLERAEPDLAVPRAVAGTALELVRVDRDVPSVRAVRQEAFADEEGRDRVAETGLERSQSPFRRTQPASAWPSRGPIATGRTDPSRSSLSRTSSTRSATLWTLRRLGCPLVTSATWSGRSSSTS